MIARRALEQSNVGRPGKVVKNNGGVGRITSGLREKDLNVPNDDLSARGKISGVEDQPKRAVQQAIVEEPGKLETKDNHKITTTQDVLPKCLTVPQDVALEEPTDETLDSVYARDIHAYLKVIEHKGCPSPTFLDNGDITPGNRRVLVAWMREVQEYLQVRQETFHLALTITDLVVHRDSVKLAEYQLLGLVGFLIAAKYLERYVPEIDTLMYLTSYAYNSRAFLDKEKEVLRILDYDLNLPTPSWFLAYYTRDDESAEVRQLAALFLDLFALDPDSTSNIPLSLRAASALMTANLFLAVPNNHRDLELESWYSVDRLQPSNRRLVGLIKGLHSKQRCSLEQTIVDTLSHRNTAV